MREGGGGRGNPAPIPRVSPPRKRRHHCRPRRFHIGRVDAHLLDGASAAHFDEEAAAALIVELDRRRAVPECLDQAERDLADALEPGGSAGGRFSSGDDRGVTSRVFAATEVAGRSVGCHRSAVYYPVSCLGKDGCHVCGREAGGNNDTPCLTRESNLKICPSSGTRPAHVSSALPTPPGRIGGVSVHLGAYSTLPRCWVPPYFFRRCFTIQSLLPCGVPRIPPTLLRLPSRRFRMRRPGTPTWMLPRGRASSCATSA